MDGEEVPVAAAVEGTVSPRSSLSLGLSTGELLVGNWSRVTHFLEGWDIPQNWARVEIPETAKLSLSEIEDCLEI